MEIPSSSTEYMMDCYSILGIAKSAKAAEIRAAYLKRALELHPDKPNGSDAEFQKLRAAFEMLSNPAQRCKYNKAWRRCRPMNNSARDDHHRYCGDNHQYCDQEAEAERYSFEATEQCSSSARPAQYHGGQGGPSVVQC